jgi:hypothetical protein
MNEDPLWKIVGKADGFNMVLYDGDAEFVSSPIEDDVVMLDNGELAIVHYVNDRISLTTESDIEKFDNEFLDNNYPP